MKKVLLMAWLALYACMLQAQTVNLFNESSIGMGDSIDQVKYQVVYDAEYIYEKKYTKTDTIIGRIEEKMLLQIGNKYSAFYTEDIPIDNGPWKLGGLPGLILKAHDSENDYGFTAVGLTTGKDSTPIYYKGKTFEPIDRKSLTSIYKKYYADPIGYLLQDAKYAAIVKIKDEKGNILKHSKRAEPYNPIER